MKGSSTAAATLLPASRDREGWTAGPQAGSNGRP